MKHPFIRRAAALALALLLALPLAAPVRASAAPAPALTITGDPEDTALAVGETVTLTAGLTTGSDTPPADAEYSWECVEGVELVAFDGESAGSTLEVTAKAVGTVKFTVTAKWTQDQGVPREVTSEPYTLTVVEVELIFASPDDKVYEPGTWSLEVALAGIDNPETKRITWEAVRASGQKDTKLPTFTGTDAEDNTDENGAAVSTTVTGTKVTVVSHGAGDFIISASYGGKTVSREVIISGIVLSGPRLDTDKDNKSIVEMFVGGSTTLTVIPYGMADDRNATKVQWSSSDSSVVSASDVGSLYAWGMGRAVITATKGKYSADCTVTAVEDTSVIATGFSATASEPLILSEVYAQLNNICLTKTRDYGDSEEGFGLEYITNLRASTSQGTLYYNYSTESDTGAGVGYNDQFALTAGGTRLGMGRLYFVPRQGFSGTAEITFSAIATNGRNISGIIRVSVSAGSEVYQISYGARAGEPVWFLDDDFDVFCRSKTGRSFNYITFTLPKPGEGTLYYNYAAGSGNPVTTAIQFTPSGRYTLDDVCFVPDANYSGWVNISFRAVDTSGETASGTVMVYVTASNTGDDLSAVRIFGNRGRPVALRSELFNDACRQSIDDALAFVVFRLPDPSEGTLYYNYRSDGSFDSRVTASARYYYSGIPGLSGVTFVPASGAVGRVAIPYTGYGSNGTSFNGTLYISLDEADRSTIYYSTAKSGTVSFRASDFNNAGLYKTGSNVSYVIFRTMSSSTGSSLGTLYFNRTNNSKLTINPAQYSNSRYYVDPTSSQDGLNRVRFEAKDAAGTVTITYDAYNSRNEELFTGAVEIQVGSLVPEDIVLSCKTSGEAWVLSWTLNGVCGAVMSQSLSYIEITGVPSAEVGHLYLNYSGFGTGTVVKPGDRFYRYGSPGIDQLTFVPRARFTGEAEITYIGCSGDGLEQVSGRIMVNVTGTTASQYFNDMHDYVWAVDSVDYLYRNETVQGVSSRRFNPGGTVIRGDFALMLVRAYGFTASGATPFDDVPPNSYYADAIRIAYLTGVVNGSNGKFHPGDNLTRQDAMVMIYNALKASGKITTNGLAADFSAYRDERQISAYAREAIGSLIQMGVVKGNGSGWLWPQSPLSRAEAAVLLHTIMTL